MFDNMKCSSDGEHGDTDVWLRVGDEHSFVYYTVGFSPLNQHTWGTASSYVTRDNGPGMWPWESECTAHTNQH